MSLSGLLAHKGAPATFTKTTPGTYDPSTDTNTAPVTVAVDVLAMEVDGDPDLYRQLGLIESENPTLLVRPVVPGTLPLLGSTVAWGGETFTAKNIKRLAMNGVATAARIVVSR